jgi:hypothetical protein
LRIEKIGLLSEREQKRGEMYREEEEKENGSEKGTWKHDYP